MPYRPPRYGFMQFVYTGHIRGKSITCFVIVYLWLITNAYVVTAFLYVYVTQDILRGKVNSPGGYCTTSIKNEQTYDLYAWDSYM